MSGPNDLKRRNGRTVIALFSIVGFMVGLSFAAVPLYDLFCRVTGFGGTTQVATAAPERTTDRLITVRFNADVIDGLGWEFRPEVRSVQVRVGEPMIVNYIAVNHESRPVIGTSTFNVTPDRAGIVFNKLQCFCFTEQRLEPGERITMPVSFFVDPSIEEDASLRDVTTITLSYTFFRATTDRLAAGG